MPQEQFRRLELMIGPEGLERLRQAHVAVIGLGAVGSYVVEALARSGIGRLRLVDFDVIHPTNLNRQLFALTSTLGLPKVQVARERVRDINPSCETQGLCVFCHVDTMDEVLAGPPDVVVDAIDALNPKVELLAALAARGIPAVSSMGAATRTDPSAVRVGRLGASHGCPLARRVRRALRRRGSPADPLCVYSVEPANVEALGEPGTGVEGGDEAPARGRARRSLGSLPTMTGIFGLAAANTVLQVLLAELLSPERPPTLRS